MQLEQIMDKKTKNKQTNKNPITATSEEPGANAGCQA